MVNKPYYREMEGGPPPLDESWWEAVLTEDEEAEPSYTERYSLNGAGAPSKPAASKLAASDLDSIDWELAKRLYEQDETIDLEVGGFNRGGLLVEGQSLQGFVPMSHLIENPGERTEEELEEWLSSYVGTSLTLKVIECDEERGRVVFSERAALAEPGSRNELLRTLQTGDCVNGTVTNITDFGVFVDLGGVEGLIHVSEISWGRVRHPADVVDLGQTARVHVIQVDRDRARVALSLKRLYPNPWDTAEERYHPGQIVDAVVTSIVPFGAFARLEEGLDGLIHVSEMVSEDGSNPKPTDLFDEGQRVKVRVMHVDGSRQRLGLSMRLED